jgi:hypothetical protein
MRWQLINPIRSVELTARPTPKSSWYHQPLDWSPGIWPGLVSIKSCFRQHADSFSTVNITVTRSGKTKCFVSDLYFVGVRVGRLENVIFLTCAWCLFYTLRVAWTSHLKSRHKLGTKHEHSNHLESKKSRSSMFQNCNFDCHWRYFL